MALLFCLFQDESRYLLPLPIPFICVGNKHTQVEKVGWDIALSSCVGKLVRKSFKKRKEAESELGKRVSLIAEGRYLDVKKDTKVTLDELTEKYIEHQEIQSQET